MTLLNLQKLIKDNNIKFPLLLSGEEAGVKEVYIKQIGKARVTPTKRFDSVMEAIRASKGSKLVKAEKFIAVVSEDKKFQTQEELWAKLPAGFELILCYEKLDARLRFTKYFENNTYEFNRMSAVQLAKYIQREIRLSDSNAADLALNSGLDYLTMKNELDKLIVYLGDLPKDDFGYLRAHSAGIFSVQWENKFDKFIMDVLRGETTSAIKEWEKLKLLGESELKVFAWLFGDFKNILLQACGEKLNPYIVGRLQSIKKYTVEALRDILWLLNDISIKVKRGKMPMDLAVDYLLVSLGG